MLGCQAHHPPCFLASPLANSRTAFRAIREDRGEYLHVDEPDGKRPLDVPADDLQRVAGTTPGPTSSGRVTPGIPGMASPIFVGPSVPAPPLASVSACAPFVPRRSVQGRRAALGGVAHAESNLKCPRGACAPRAVLGQQ